MEPQWPLILFTTLVAWSAGLFASQGALALRGGGRAAQLPALACSAALLAAGGVAVSFHLEHWERVFNGFGHLTSGIAQELAAVVLAAAAMAAWLALLRRSGGALPAWAGWAAVLASALLVAVVGRSYMMAARPAWDSALQVLTLIGAACALGPATFAAIASAKGEAPAAARALALAGTALAALAAAAYVAWMAAAGGSFAEVGPYFDPTRPTAPLSGPSACSPFSPAVLPATACALACAIAATACAALARARSDWRAPGAAVAALSAASAVALRVAFYAAGGSVFMFY